MLKNLINRIYNLSELHFKPTAKGFDGNMTLKLGTQLKEKASLNLQALIIDPTGCEGPRSVTKVPGKWELINASYELRLIYDSLSAQFPLIPCW